MVQPIWPPLAGSPPICPHTLPSEKEARVPLLLRSYLVSPLILSPLQSSRRCLSTPSESQSCKAPLPSPRSKSHGRRTFVGSASMATIGRAAASVLHVWVRRWLGFLCSSVSSTCRLGAIELLYSKLLLPLNCIWLLCFFYFGNFADNILE